MSEKETREKLIDKQLSRAGWFKKYIKEEVNSVKSNFKKKEYIENGPIEKKVDRFIDYLLLDESNSPVAIIEAKDYSKDPKKGRIQARTYRGDIERQIGYRIPIFLTNGEVWYYLDSHDIERKVSGVFSQEDLHRRLDLFLNEKNPSNIKINANIVDRARSVLNIKLLSEHFEKGHRKALIQMATGTGKTRVAMALVDLLVRANYVRRVLFVADRITLADQASAEGFKKFFKEPAQELHQDGFDSTKRFYSSTVQTLLNIYEKFSPGFFDLIIFDEAHRGIFEKNKLVYDYFDALKIGLTATPRESESKNTYLMFDCEIGKPTVEYEYEEAVRDGILANYRTKIIATEVLSLGIRGGELTPELEDQLRKQETSPKNLILSGPEFGRAFMDDKTNELIIREFMNSCYKSDEGLPCKTIFFCVNQKHAKKMKDVFGKMFPKLSGHVQVITSDEYRAQDEIKRFKKKNEPRIALSVGMLDTGVDIPEICNLVFVKPIYSSIRFWQMFGRGTRNINACKRYEWLPNKEKKDFLILDFAIGGYSNVIAHNLGKSKDKDTGRDVITEIFKNRVSLLDKKLNENQKRIITNKILSDVKALDENSFIVRERLSTVRKVKESFDLEKYIRELKEEIAPLMILNTGNNAEVSSFILQVERLFKYVLVEDQLKITKVRDYVKERLENILAKDNLSEIKAKKKDIILVLQEKYWEDLTFEKIELIITKLALLMKYYQKEKGTILQIDKPDSIIEIRESVNEIKKNERLIKFIEKNPLLQKIRSGKGITSKELSKLEEQLIKLNPAYTIDNVQKSLKMDFMLFLHQIIGLTKEYDPKILIEREFDKLIINSGTYNAKQIEFLQLLKKFFSDRKHIELKDFADAPLTGADPLDKFSYEEIEEIKKKCDKIKIS